MRRLALGFLVGMALERYVVMRMVVWAGDRLQARIAALEQQAQDDALLERIRDW